MAFGRNETLFQGYSENGGRPNPVETLAPGGFGGGAGGFGTGGGGGGFGGRPMPAATSAPGYVPGVRQETWLAGYSEGTDPMDAPPVATIHEEEEDEFGSGVGNSGYRSAPIGGFGGGRGGKLGGGLGGGFGGGLSSISEAPLPVPPRKPTMFKRGGGAPPPPSRRGPLSPPLRGGARPAGPSAARGGRGGRGPTPGRPTRLPVPGAGLTSATRDETLLAGYSENGARAQTLMQGFGVPTMVPRGGIAGGARPGLGAGAGGRLGGAALRAPTGATRDETLLAGYSENGARQETLVNGYKRGSLVEPPVLKNDMFLYDDHDGDDDEEVDPRTGLAAITEEEEEEKVELTPPMPKAPVPKLTPKKFTSPSYNSAAKRPSVDDLEVVAARKAFTKTQNVPKHARYATHAGPSTSSSGGGAKSSTPSWQRAASTSKLWGAGSESSSAKPKPSWNRAASSGKVLGSGSATSPSWKPNKSPTSSTSPSWKPKASPTSSSPKPAAFGRLRSVSDNKDTEKERPRSPSTPASWKVGGGATVVTSSSNGVASSLPTWKQKQMEKEKEKEKSIPTWKQKQMEKEAERPIPAWKQKQMEKEKEKLSTPTVQKVSVPKAWKRQTSSPNLSPSSSSSSASASVPAWKRQQSSPTTSSTPSWKQKQSSPAASSVPAWKQKQSSPTTSSVPAWKKKQSSPTTSSVPTWKQKQLEKEKAASSIVSSSSTSTSSSASVPAWKQKLAAKSTSSPVFSAKSTSSSPVFSVKSTSSSAASVPAWKQRQMEKEKPALSPGGATKKFCTSCGTKQKPGNKFCEVCGNKH